MLLRLSSWLRERMETPRCSLVGQHAWESLRACHHNTLDFIKNHPRLGGGIIISIAVFVFLGGWYAWCLTPVQPLMKQKITVEIPYGASLRQVGRGLQTKGLIHDELAFELFVRLGSPKMLLKAGRYRFSPDLSLGEIVNRLYRGVVDGERVTLPEGLTIAEVADTLEKQGLIHKERFLRLLKDQPWIENQFKTNFPTNDWPEGFLFPDTYQFPVGASEEEIIATMLKRFETVFSSHFPRVPADERRKIVIIASLVEKEAKKPEERAIIAGVFYNRLRRDYPLQSCATVEYALGRHKIRLSYRDIKINSPYNTYEHYGLPPGPIANPGLASLAAAVNPAKVDYLYFVAKHDGSHVFSQTYEEHLQAQHRIGR